MSLRNRNMHKDADIYADEYIFGDRDIFSNIDRGIGKGKFKVGRTCPKTKVDEKLIEGESIEVPLKLLHEGEGHGVTVELKKGDVCRGKLIESENNWTLQLDTATFVFRKGHLLFDRPPAAVHKLIDADQNHLLEASGPVSDACEDTERLINVGFLSWVYMGAFLILVDSAVIQKLV